MIDELRKVYHDLRPFEKYNTGRWIPPGLLPHFYTLVKDSGCVQYIECGTANGFSTLVAAAALPTEGRIFTFDPVNRPKIWEEETVYRQFKHDIRKIFYNRSTFIKGLGRVVPLDRPTFVFLDGDHRYPSIKADWEIIEPHLKKGDVVVFDDITVSGPKKAFSRLTGYNKRTINRFGIIEL